MVIFQTPGGSPGYNQFESLEEAVDFVEQLRNERDITNARMFALEEIKFEVKPYYKVEIAALPSGSEQSSEPAAAATPPPPAAPASNGAPPAPASAPAEEKAPPAAAPTFGSPPDSGGSDSEAGSSPAGQGGDGPARRGLFGR